MAISESNRHRLYQRLEEVLGIEEADVLMEHLPPVGWADVTTKHDLAELERRLDQRFDLEFKRVDLQFKQVNDRLDERFAGFGGELTNLRSDLTEIRTTLRTLTVAMVSAMAVLAGAVVAAIRL